MGKDKTLGLSIQIAGKVDRSLMSAINQAQKGVSSLSSNLSKIGTAGLAAMGALATGTVAAIVDCTNAAKDFEAQMGDVVKYVSGLADETGKISNKIDKDTGRSFAENYGMMKDALLDLSTQIPMTAEELTKLAAAAGQSGKGINDLIQYDSNGNIKGFLKDVAMMGTAWDIEADQAGNWAAKWEKSFNMTHDQVMVLADQINYLGANSATTAAEIGEVVNRAASVGQIAGVDVSTTAALADAMLATGVESERAGTALKNMYTRMSMGESSTKRQKEMWMELGFTAEDIAKSMQTDAIGTTKAVFEAINDLPDERRLAAIKDLFGMWTAEGAAKIANNLDVYTDALAMVSDPSLYSGSMEREFIIKASTAESIDTMLANSWQALKIQLGDAFLPVKKEFSILLSDIINDVRTHMPQIKEIAGNMATALHNGIEKLGTAIDKAEPYIERVLDYVAKNGDKVVSVIGGLAAAFAGMKAAPLIESLLGGGASLLFGSKGAFGRQSGGLVNLFKQGQNAGNLLWDGAKKGIAANASGKAGLFGAAGSGAIGILGTLQNWGGLTSGSKNKQGAAGKTLTNLLNAQGANGGLGGMISSMFSNSRAGKMAGGVGNYFGNLRNAVGGIGQTRIGTAVGGVGKTAGGALKNLGSIAQAGFMQTKPGQAIGTAMTGIGNIGGAIGNAAAGAKMLGGNIMGAISGPLSAVTEFGGGILNVATTALGPIGGMFGSLLSGALPIVGVISGIIAVFSILYDNLDGVRTMIGNVFGEKGLAVFDTFKGGLDNVLGYVNNILGGGLGIALQGVREAFVGLFSGDAAQMAGETFDSVVMILQAVLGTVKKVVDFAVTTVKPIIQDIFTFLTTTVLPIILQTFNNAAPIIVEIIHNAGDAVMMVAQIIAEAINFAMPLIKDIITVVMTVGSVVVPAVLAAINAGFEGISSVMTSIKGVFDGLISFITGVFTGNWAQAWEGVKSIFKNAFDALVTLCKTPINAVIAIINKAISGINKLGLTIPDWVPGIGGQSFKINIPTIGALAKGGFTNGPSIAGEAGTEAVISFDRSVRAANIETWAKAGELLGVNTQSNAKELRNFDAGGRQENHITFSPQITIQGSADQGVVDNLIEQMQEMFERFMRERERRQLRTAY